VFRERRLSRPACGATTWSGQSTACPSRQSPICRVSSRSTSTVPIRFKPHPGEDDFRRAHGVWRIGIRPPQQSSSTERVGVAGAIKHGFDQTTYILRATIGYLGDVFTGRQSADQIGGIGHMVDVAGTIARKYSVFDLIPLAAMISASVGLMNLLPFLPLDGGHLVNHAVEAVRGRPLSLRSQEVQAIFGLTLVASLFFLAFFNDLTIYHRWIFG
jgi:regulator of sigma E protease